jgi:hypothetical protein
MDEIKLSLEKFRQWAMPGGTIMFNYNDCNEVFGAKFHEDGLRTYTTTKMIVDLCQSLDYKILHIGKYKPGAISWIELEKPGIRKRPKLASALGAILDK